MNTISSLVSSTLHKAAGSRLILRGWVRLIQALPRVGIGMRMSATTRFRLLIRTAYSSEPAEAQKTVDATAIQSDQVEAALVASKTVWISPVLRCMRHWQEAVRSSARTTTA